MTNRRLLPLPRGIAGSARRLLQAAALPLALVLAVASLPAAAQTYTVEIDTSALAGVNGFMAFDLVDGTTAVPSSVVIDGFTSTSALGSATTNGDVSGTLPGPVIIASTSFFTNLLQGVHFAAGHTTFSLSLTVSHEAPAIPDSFALFLLDSTQAPFATSDPTGANALLVFDLTDPLVPQVFTSPFALATVSLVPEPGSWALYVLGLSGLALIRKKA